MQIFKDRFGQDWCLALTYYGVEMLEAFDFSIALKSSEPKFLCFNPPEKEIFDHLLGNTRFIFAMLWCLCKEQIDGKTFVPVGRDEEKPVKTELDFAQCFDGKTMAKAREALYKELPDFFQETGTSYQTLTERFLKTQQLLNKRLEKELKERMDDKKILAILDTELAKLDG